MYFSYLLSISKYKDFVSVSIGSASDMSPGYFVINLKTKKVDIADCIPNESLICSGIKYQKTIGNKYNEVEYKIDYENDKYNKISEEEINCDNYNYDMYNDNSCTDDICSRRLQFCYPQI